MKKFDASIRRKMYWSDNIETPNYCPDCGGSLEKEPHTYVVLTKKGDEIESFMVGNNGGAFCSDCPVVVLDNATFSKLASAGMPDLNKIVVAGIVDLEAIPEEKRDIPLGEDDNPIPLIEFLPDKFIKKNNAVKRTKIGRNAPCPCGSGKKYKKCCG